MREQVKESGLDFYCGIEGGGRLRVHAERGLNDLNTPFVGRGFLSSWSEVGYSRKRMECGLKLSPVRHQTLESINQTRSEGKILGIQTRKVNFLLATEYRGH